MNQSFKEGQAVQGITHPDGSEIHVGCVGVDKITVVSEYGQMAGVPWFAVWKGDKITDKYNGAHLARVTL